MVDKSITTKLLTPVREWMVTLVPPTIAPTVLSLTALLSVIQAWYVCIMYSESFPEWVSFAGAALGTIFWCLHSIQSLHARQQRQDTAVTELFGYVCDNLATVFLMLVFCMLLGLDSLESRWYVVQTGQLVLMRKHMSAFSRECPRSPVVAMPSRVRGLCWQGAEACGTGCSLGPARLCASTSSCWWCAARWGWNGWAGSTSAPGLR